MQKCKKLQLWESALETSETKEYPLDCNETVFLQMQKKKLLDLVQNRFSSITHLCI